MSNLRAVDAAMGLGIFGAVILGAIAVSQLAPIESALHQIDGKLIGPKSGGGTSNSPLSVRGGSMTAFTNSPGAATTWTIKDGLQLAYCAVVADTSYIEYDQGGATAWSQSKITSPWEIDISGHAPYDYATGGHPSGNGFKLVSQQTDCSGNTGKYSVVISMLSNSGGFYRPLPNSTPHTSNLRFMDNSLGGCSGGGTSNNDQDLCERMAQVVVIMNPGSKTATSTTLAPCIDGDCDVEIGKPK